MEAQTATTPSDAATGSKTLADLLPLAVEKHAAKVAQKFKDQSTGEWVDVSYPELGQIAKEVSLGLQELGIDRGDKVGILSNTRPEWTYADFGILATGGTVVPIYQTNSPEECHYVLEHSESVAVILEDQSQLDKIRKVRDQLPNLRHVISMEPLDGDDVMSMEELRERGRGRSDDDFKQRVATVEGSDVATYIYTSGTTGPPKGCVIDHQNWRDMLDMVQSQNVLMEDEVAYLFLPLAHAFARLIQLGSLDVGATIVYWERDPQKIIPNLMEVKPTYFPSVPRMFEKIYSLANSNAPDKAQLEQAVQLGLKVRQMQDRGEAVPAELQEAFDKADAALFQNVRNIFGGRIKQAVTGAAPIAQEILEFFYACGVLVLEGWGMTETSTAATCNTAEEFRFGSVGKPFPGVEVKIAADGEILARGPNIFRGYYKNPEATAETIVDRWLHTGDIGRIDEDGFLYITGRKKDIIITAGGKNITPANLEAEIKQHPMISQCVVIGDRRPFLVAVLTLDPEEAAKFAEEKGADPAALHADERIRASIQAHLDQVNQKFARVEQVKKFEILPRDFSQEGGELTPSMKVKRNVVAQKYADEVERLYAG